MAIKKVWIEEGCMTSGFCQKICPEVFVVDQEAFVLDVDNLNDFEQQIIEAADNCPAEVIKFA
ncbi:ferredoxin [Bacteroidota bacterium]